MVKTDRKMDFLPSSDGGIVPPVSALVDGECLGSRPYCPRDTRDHHLSTEVEMSSTVDMRLDVTVPVSDVDRTKDFYLGLRRAA